MLTGAQLKLICSKCKLPDIVAEVLYKAMVFYEINTVTRAAAFIGQLAHESNEFNSVLERSNGSLYEGRKDLGNTSPGDGPKYKGRGFIQLTGRANYARFGKLTGLDLENSPELAELTVNAAHIAATYWTEHGCNELADKLDFQGITKKINGGYNGHQDRLWYFHRALEVLGVEARV